MPHKLGQVFLHDKHIIRKIVEQAHVKPDEIVVEIGCGEGIMSAPLSEAASKLIVIEIDEKCIEMTRPVVGENTLFVHQDVLDVDFHSFNETKMSVVANIPYYISAKIIKKLASVKSLFSRITLMVQYEFGEKLLSNPGDSLYTSLAVFTKTHFKVERCFKVSKTCFKPVPKVDSIVISLTPTESHYDALFYDVVRSAFWGRRKPLISALKKSPYIKLSSGFEKIPFFDEHATIRGERLDLESFLTLYNQLRNYIKT